MGCPYFSIIWASSRENLSSGSSSKRDSNQSPQLQRQSRNFNGSKFTYEIFQKASAPVLFANPPKTGFLATRPICTYVFPRKGSFHLHTICSDIIYACVKVLMSSHRYIRAEQRSYKINRDIHSQCVSITVEMVAACTR